MEGNSMRKLITATVLSALAVGVVAAPSAFAVKAPKPVAATVSVVPTPTTITPTTTTVTADGNVSSTSSCRKDRTVRFAYVNTTTNVVTPLTETAVTGSNGDYTVVLPKPTDAAPATVVLRATVDQVIRKVGSKKKGKKNKKGRQFDCLTTTADSVPLTVSD
jgi:hypothetical protein